MIEEAAMDIEIKHRDGRVLWHGYYSLGHDIEPTCTEDESKPK